MPETLTNIKFSLDWDLNEKTLLVVDINDMDDILQNVGGDSLWNVKETLKLQVEVDNETT